jgi:hypothetical protein
MKKILAITLFTVTLFIFKSYAINLPWLEKLNFGGVFLNKDTNNKIVKVNGGVMHKLSH